MILVTGATGFIGQAVVRSLRQRHYALRLLVRDSRRARRVFPSLDIELVEGDVCETTILEQALVGVHAVVHLVGIISERREATFEKMHVAATQTVVDAMRRAGVSRLIHMSALGVRPYARTRYHQTKWHAEEIVRSSGLAWTIMRPSIVYGPGDHFLNFFARFARPPIDFLQLYTFPVLGGGENRLQPIHVDDVASAFARSLGDARTVGSTLDLCGLQPLTFRALMEEIAQRCGHTPVWDPYGGQTLLRHALWASTFYTTLFFLALLTLGQLTPGWGLGLLVASCLGTYLAKHWTTLLLFPVPMPFLKTLSWVLDRIVPDRIRTISERWLGAPLPSEAQMGMLEEDNVGDPTRASHLLDFTPKTLQEGLSYLESSN